MAVQNEEHNEFNPTIRRNGLIFGILALITHIIACFIFGFFFVIKASTNIINTIDPTVFVPIFNMFAHGLLIIGGFGLLFSYLRKMSWSGMGFALLICALCFQFFFMFNAFWIKADVLNAGQNVFTNDDKTFNFYLTDIVEPETNYGATGTGAFRCSLAILIAFSSVLGRAGPLEAWIISFFGSFGYQLNRQIIENYGFDLGGAYSIFVFGGFMGLMIGIFRFLRERDQTTTTARHQEYTASRFSASLALLGCLIIWIFFPVLVFDNTDAKISANMVYTAPFTIMFSLASATITSVMISLLFNGGRVGVRDLIYGTVAGAIATSSASAYVTKPVYGILFGFIAAAIQVLVMNTIQKSFARQRNILNTYSFTLFGMQGLLGCIFAAAWQAVNLGFSDGFDFSFDSDAVYGFVDGLISAAMGIGFGLIAGIFVMLVSSHESKHHFTDYSYWLPSDGIRYEDLEQIQVIEHSRIKNKHAYI